MKCDKRTMLMYVVTDRSWEGKMSLMQQVEAALENGATCIQLREKDLCFDEFLREAVEMKALCRRYGVPFIVNDNVDVACACHADGIHVGQEDMEAGDVRRRVGSEMIIGVSVHDVEEAEIAVKNGADYLGLGAAFPTSTKNDADCMSLEMIGDICRAVDIPTVAIGGINRDTIMKLSGSGVDGVAVISAVFAAEDPGAATAELLRLSEEMVSKNE